MSTLNLGDSLILDTDYSTTETKTGATWINGKPIYRKVYVRTLTSTFPTSDQFIITNADLPPIGILVNLKGMLEYGTGNWEPANLNYPFGSNPLKDYYVFLDYYKGGGGIRCNWKGWYGTLYVTIEYTKTTD